MFHWKSWILYFVWIKELHKESVKILKGTDQVENEHIGT